MIIIFFKNKVLIRKKYYELPINFQRKKDTSCNCADTKQNWVHLPFTSDFFCFTFAGKQKLHGNISL